MSFALHLAKLVVTLSEVIVDSVAARDVPVAVFLSSWVGISASSRAHLQYIHVLAEDKSHMHAS